MQKHDSQDKLGQHSSSPTHTLHAETEREIPVLPYQVVGHRGYPERFPENTLRGLVAAAKVGAPCVELDVQISRDKVPMVFHDASLARVTGGRAGKVWDFSAQQLQAISCHEPHRFAEQYAPTPISTLQEVCEALAAYSCDVFVELKKESLAYISREDLLHCVAAAVAPIRDRVFIISFDFEILVLAKQQWRVGWVLSDMRQTSLLKAQMLAPEVLAYDVKKVSRDNTLWPGPWRWFLWDIVSPELAEFWHRHGVTYIESWNPEALLNPLLDP